MPHSVIRVGLATTGVLLAMGTVTAIAGAAQADYSFTIATCSGTNGTSDAMCNLSGTIPGDPTGISATATATGPSPTSPSSVSVQLTVTCDEDGTAEVMTGAEVQPTPYTNVPVWEASKYPALGPTPESYSSCTFTGYAEDAGPGGTTYSVTLSYQTNQNPSPSASPSESPSPAVAAPVDLVRGFDGKCMQDMGDSAAKRTKITIWTCDPTAQGQGWTYRSGELRIHGSMCVNAKGTGASGSPVILWPCSGTPNEIWLRKSGSEYALKAGTYKVCLTDPGFSTSNGTQLTVRACTNARNQRWSLPKAATGY
jgi:hypothetical protein